MCIRDRNNPLIYFDPSGLFASVDNLYVGGKNDVEDVKKLQNELKWLGYYNGEKDGSYGPQTEAAVKRYQADAGLKVDGIVGKNTWLSLGLKLEQIIFYEQTFTIEWESNYTIKVGVRYQTDEYGNLLSAEGTGEQRIISNAWGYEYQLTFLDVYRKSENELGIDVTVKETYGISLPCLLYTSIRAIYI